MQRERRGLYGHGVVSRNSRSRLLRHSQVLELIQELVDIYLGQLILAVRLHLCILLLLLLIDLHALGLGSVLVKLEGVSELLVFLDVLEEELKVALGLLLVLLAGKHLALLLGHTAQLPVAVLVLLAAEVVFLNEDDFRDAFGVAKLEFFQVGVVEVGAGEGVTHGGISRMEDTTKVGAHHVGLVVVAHVGGFSDLGIGEDPAAADGTERLNVEDDELDEFGDICEGGEGGAPVYFCVEFGCLEGVWVEEMSRVSDFAT